MYTVLCIYCNILHNVIIPMIYNNLMYLPYISSHTHLSMNAYKVFTTLPAYSSLPVSIDISMMCCFIPSLNAVIAATLHYLSPIVTY